MTYFSVPFNSVNIYGNGLVSLGEDLEQYANMTNTGIMTNQFAYLLVPFYTVFSDGLVAEGENWEVIVESYDPR